jgi:hypothetical protein
MDCDITNQLDNSEIQLVSREITVWGTIFKIVTSADPPQVEYMTNNFHSYRGKKLRCLLSCWKVHACLRNNVYLLFYFIIVLCWDWPQLLKQCSHILSDIYGCSSNKIIVSQTPVYFHVQSTCLTVAKVSNYMEFYAVSLTFWSIYSSDW